MVEAWQASMTRVGFHFGFSRNLSIWSNKTWIQLTSAITTGHPFPNVQGKGHQSSGFISDVEFCHVEANYLVGMQGRIVRLHSHADGNIRPNIGYDILFLRTAWLELLVEFHRTLAHLLRVETLSILLMEMIPFLLRFRHKSCSSGRRIYIHTEW